MLVVPVAWGDAGDDDGAEKGPPGGMPAGLTVTARFSVPVFGVVQGVTRQDGETWSQPELEVDTEKSAAAPAPEMAITWGQGWDLPPSN